MALAIRTSEDDFADHLVALVAGDGSGGHPYLHSAELNVGADASRNLADVVHHLAMLHGRTPCLVESAASLNLQPAARLWFLTAAAGFAAERAVIARLVVGAGAMPSTPGQAGCETAVLGQRRALETLTRSDRVGCAIGAAAALLLDWQSIRAVLDTAGDRLGMAVPASTLPDEDETLGLLCMLARDSMVERAVLFGARQLLAHHSGLWDLLEARQSARATLDL